ncbi:MAG: hypothetical protein VCD00_14785 [Candidatus Hydrogenedentota bacterium]
MFEKFRIPGIILVIVMSGWLVITVGGCGAIADPDRKVIANFEGEKFRRGDLRDVIREMSDEDRPLIQTRDDLVETLNDHLNKQILIMEARELRIEEKLEVSREHARRIYFAKHPEYVNVEKMTDPSVMGISQNDLMALQAELEFGIDDEMELLFQAAAFEYRVQHFIETAKPKIEEWEFEDEYDARKESLFTFETVDFIGIRFPLGPGAQKEAVKARGRIDAGEPFQDVLRKYLALSPDFGIRAAFDNNPTKMRFVQFWYGVTGSKKGDLVGPVFLPSHDQMRPGPDGRMEVKQETDSWVVLEVIDSEAPRQKSLEESKQELVMPILRRRVMDELRASYGVEIFPEELWRPEGYGNQFKDSMIETSVKR